MAEGKSTRFGKVFKRMTRQAKVTFASLFILFFVGIVSYYFLYGRVDYTPLFSNLSMKESGNIVTKLDELKITDYKMGNNGSSILVSADDIDRVRVELAMSGLIPNEGVGYEIFDEASFAITDEDRAIMYQRALEGELARSIMALEEVTYARVHLALSEETLFSRESTPGNATVIVELNPLHDVYSNQVKGIVALVSSAINNLPPQNVSVIDTNANVLSENLYSDGDSMSVGQSAIETISIKQQFEAQLQNELETLLERTYGVGNIVVDVDARLNLNSEETTIIEYEDTGVLKNQQDYFTRKTDTSNSSDGMSPVDDNIEYYAVDTSDAMNDSSISNFETTRSYEVGETRTYKITAPGEIISLSTAVIFDGSLDAAEAQAIKNIVSASIGLDESRGDFISVEGIPFDRTYEKNLIAEFDLAEQEFIAKEEKSKKFTFYGEIAGGSILLILIIIMVIRLFTLRGNSGDDQRFYEALQPIPVNELIENEGMKIKPFQEEDIEIGIKHYAEENPAKLADLVKTWMLKDEG